MKTFKESYKEIVPQPKFKVGDWVTLVPRVVGIIRSTAGPYKIINRRLSRGKDLINGKNRSATYYQTYNIGSDHGSSEQHQFWKEECFEEYLPGLTNKEKEETKDYLNI